MDPWNITVVDLSQSMNGAGSGCRCKVLTAKQGGHVARHIIVLALSCFILAGCIGGNNKTDNSVGQGALNVDSSFELPEQEKDNFVTAVCFANGSLFAGTEKSVYEAKYDREKKTFELVKKHSAALENSKVNSIRSHGSDIIVASQEGYSRLGKEGWVRQTIGNSNDIMPVDKDLWSATNSGIEILRQNAGDWRTFEVNSATDYSPTKKMTSLATDGKQDVWVGTEFGLHHFDLSSYLSFMSKLRAGGAGASVDTGSFWRRYYGDYQNPTGGLLATEKGNCPLSGNFIVAIRRDGQRYLLCTKRGLNVYDGKGWSSFIGTGSVYAMSDDGQLERRQKPGNIDVPTPEVYDVVAFQSKLYLATRSGLAIVNEADLKTKMITMEEGLPSDRVRALSLDPAGPTLFIGTENGLAALHIAPAGS